MSATDKEAHFNSITTPQWEQLIRAELGEDAIAKLSTRSEEGILVAPFYHFDTQSSPPFQYHPDNWRIAERLDAGQLSSNDYSAIKEHGVEALILRTPEGYLPDKKTAAYLKKEAFPIFLEAEGPLESITPLSKAFKENELHLQLDILGHLVRNGNWHLSEQADWSALKKILEAGNYTTGISIDGTIYRNSGANRIQELAYIMAQGNEYLNFIASRKITSKATKVLIKVAVGSNFFFEIAKLKALRWLWQSLLQEYGYNGDCLILAEPEVRNKSALDYNINMVRTTTECMSAIIGGADFILNHPYDKVYNKPNEFGSRIARNQLSILKYESHFNKLSDPAYGSYYISHLTKELAEGARKEFSKIESGGGFLAQLKAGVIQDSINVSAEKEQNSFKKGIKKLTGVNQDEEQAEIPPGFNGSISEHTGGNGIIESLAPSRLAHDSEIKRLGHG